MNMLALLVTQVFFSPDVMVKMDAPAKVKQGEQITISITINKGSIAGVGHMKQELPAGFNNVVVLDAKGAEFKYLAEDNVVKFTWISLPADQEFTVSYKFSVDPSMINGNVALGGKFSYVLDNQKQTFELPSQTIMVGEEATAASTTTIEPETTTVATTTPETTAVATATPETTAVTTTTPEVTAAQPETTAVATTTTPETTTTTPVATTTTPTETKIAPAVTASRTIVGSPEAGMEFTVEVNVMKDGMKGFARVQETLPAGLTAMSLENKGGTFSFIDGKVKIIWDNLPAEEELKVSYRIAVSDNASGDMTINGSFSYVDNNDPQKAEIAATTISVKPKTTMATNTNTTSTTPDNTTQTPPDNTTVATTSSNKVDYKVQICALSKVQRSTSYFESKYGISGKVGMEFHEGWKKYTSGKYSQYKDARDYRETVRIKGIESPFVTAYNNGKRITVQEALMVSSQQWIR